MYITDQQIKQNLIKNAQNLKKLEWLKEEYNRLVALQKSNKNKIAI